MNPLDEGKAVMFVNDIEPLVQKQSLHDYQTKRNGGEALVLQIPKSVIQREVIRLCDLQREAIFKLFWENLDIPEIAHRMKLRPKSVQKLIETALMTMRRRLVSMEDTSPA